MALETVMLPHPSCESGGNERVEKEPLEEGEIEEDEDADEDLHLSRSLLPAKDLITVSKRKRRRKDVAKKRKQLLKKRKLELTSPSEWTMKVNHDDGTFQTDGDAQGKYHVIRSNDIPYRNRDEYLVHSDSFRDCSHPYSDKKDHKKYNINKGYCLGIKRSSHDSLLHEHPRNTPKNITRKYRKLIRERAAPALCTKDHHKNSNKKIPSLLGIKLPISPQFVTNNSNITVKGEESTRSICDATRVDETKPGTLMPSSLKKESFSNIQQGDINSFAAPSDPNHNQMQQTVSGKEEKLSIEKEQLMIFNRQNDIGGCIYDCISAVSSSSLRSCTKKSQTEIKHHIFPHNLPKKQQELFLRIQNKQRPALGLRNRHFSEQDKSRDEEDAKETIDEQDWYSSDEDDSSLVEVLKNLPGPQPFPLKASISSISAPIFGTPSSSSMSESSYKLLPSVRDQSSNNIANLRVKYVPSPQVCEEFHAMMQMPATQSREPRFTLRNHYNSTTSATISAVDITEHNTQTPVPTNSSSEEIMTYCSSLENPSAYNAAIESRAGGGIGFSQNGSGVVDFRNVHTVQQKIPQPNFKRDEDLRKNSRPLTSHFSTVNKNMIHRGAVSSKDVDEREIMGLSFKLIPFHKPAAEIIASLTSHAPIPYKLVPIAIPPPDYSGLRVNYAQISRDPRLHRSSRIYNGIKVS
jgi:hypothetical protein